MKKWIDIRSDTVTRPTEAMRRAMAEADVGDDVYRDDPTVNRLEALAAEKAGKEAALFVPSGTMGNQLAIMVHTTPGDEIIVGARCHVVAHEVGGRHGSRGSATPSSTIRTTSSAPRTSPVWCAGTTSTNPAPPSSAWRTLSPPAASCPWT